MQPHTVLGIILGIVAIGLIFIKERPTLAGPVRALMMIAALWSETCLFYSPSDRTWPLFESTIEIMTFLIGLAGLMTWGTPPEKWR